MSQIEKLARVYERHVGVAWQRTMAGAQRVMLAVYPKEKERLLRARLSEFDEATRRTGHEWTLIDATPWFAEWMGAHEYRESYFEDPELLDMNLEGEFSRGSGRPTPPKPSKRLMTRRSRCAPRHRIAVRFPARLRADPGCRAFHPRADCSSSSPARRTRTTTGSSTRGTAGTISHSRSRCTKPGFPDATSEASERTTTMRQPPYLELTK